MPSPSSTTTTTTTTYRTTTSSTTKTTTTRPHYTTTTTSKTLSATYTTSTRMPVELPFRNGDTLTYKVTFSGEWIGKSINGGVKIKFRIMKNNGIISIIPYKHKISDKTASIMRLGWPASDLLFSIGLNATLKYNVLFDNSMIENIFETNTSEALRYLNANMLLYFFMTGILSSMLILFVKIKPAKNIWIALSYRIILIVIAVIGIGILYITFYKGYSSIGRNNSYLNRMINPAYFYSSVKYIIKNHFKEKLTYIKIGEDATLTKAKNNKPTLMILFLGETARAQNSFYNGYARDTNPFTKQYNLLALQDVSTCGTATAVSVPCMFSNMPRENYNKDRANAQDNVLDILKRAGVNIVWKDNDEGGKGVNKHIKTLQITQKEKEKHCANGECYDSILLDNLKPFINQDDSNKLICLHLFGSHGPTYYKRYPDKFKKFKPSCNTSDLTACSDKEIVNVYDNTLVYTDYILAESIKFLKQYSDKYNVVMMYLSDHGESLGENGFYLHGSPYMIAPIEQRRVPWYIWMPDEYAQAKGIDKECLKKKLKETSGLSHDNFFHTLLGLYSVETSAKDSKLDIISSCKK